MGILKELNTEFATFPSLRSLVSTAKLDLGKRREVKLNLRRPGNVPSIEASIPGLKVNYDLKSRDLVIERKRAVRLGDLTLRQRLPYRQLYLFPSPEVKLQVKPGFLFDNKLRSELTLTHHFERSYSKVEQDLVLNNKYKLSLAMDTLTKKRGASVGLTAKLDRKYMTTVGVTGSAALGPVLKYEGKVLSGKKGVRVKADYRLKHKDIKLEVQPPNINKLRLTLTSFVKTNKLVKPSLMVAANLAL